MSAGHRHAGKITQERDQQLRLLLADPRFAKAVGAYKNEDSTKQIPYLGGSNNEGDTVFWDKNFADRVKQGLFRIKGKPEDPRPVGKVHEAVEGTMIRHYGKDYYAAHDMADTAERHAAAARGWDWNEYQNAYKPMIHEDEHEQVTNPPHNLLLKPYEGTALHAKLAAFQRPADPNDPSEQGDDKSMPIGLAENPPGHPFRCGACEWFDMKSGTCQNKNPRLHGQRVDPIRMCCNLYDNDQMKIIIR